MAKIGDVLGQGEPLTDGLYLRIDGFEKKRDQIGNFVVIHAGGKEYKSYSSVIRQQLLAIEEQEHNFKSDPVEAVVRVKTSDSGRDYVVMESPKDDSTNAE